jgi:hypothetical protein
MLINIWSCFVAIIVVSLCLAGAVLLAAHLDVSCQAVVTPFVLYPSTAYVGQCHQHHTYHSITVEQASMYVTNNI